MDNLTVSLGSWTVAGKVTITNFLHTSLWLLKSHVQNPNLDHNPATL